jgi:hypothetical protein
MEAVYQFPDDCLPPEAEYESRDSLYAAINAWAAPRGYAFAIGRSRKENSGKTTTEFNCDRGAGRIPSNTIVRVRNTSSRRIGCRFSVMAKESLDHSTWTLRHRQAPEFKQHNHGPSLSAAAHPIHRQIADNDRDLIKHLSSAGIAPRDISSFLQIKGSSSPNVIQQDIYNCIA